MKKLWGNSKQCVDCSSYNFGLPLRICLRICSIIGIISALLYIIAGTSLITHISQNERATFSSAGNAYTEKTRHIYYRRNAGFFVGIAVVLILINLVQLVSDALLFYTTLKTSKSRSLWVFFLLDVILWILTLICFVTIFSGGGLFLLLVFLLGTAIRAYIIFILHEFMSEESKIHGKDSEAAAPTSETTRIATIDESGSLNEIKVLESIKESGSMENLSFHTIAEDDDNDKTKNCEQDPSTQNSTQNAVIENVDLQQKSSNPITKSEIPIDVQESSSVVIQKY